MRKEILEIMRTHGKTIAVETYGVTSCTCDMCGKPADLISHGAWWNDEDGDPNITTTIRKSEHLFGGETIDDEFDLCPACFDKVVEFIKGINK